MNSRHEAITGSRCSWPRWVILPPTMPVSRDEMTNRLSAPPALAACSAPSRSVTLFIGWVVSRCRAFSSAPRKCYFVVEMLGVKYSSTHLAFGATSLRSSIRLAAISSVRNVMPVKFLLGRARDAAIPARIGLSLTPPTMGMLPLLASNSDLITSPPTASREVGLLRDKFSG